MPFGLYLVSLVAWIQCCDSSTSNIGQNVSFDLTLVYDAYSTCHRYFGTTNHTITTLDALNEIFVSTWIVYSDIISPPNSTLFNDSFVHCSKAHNSVSLTTYFIVEFITDYEDNTFTDFSRNTATSIQSYCNHTVSTLIYMNPLVRTVEIVNHDQNVQPRVSSSLVWTRAQLRTVVVSFIIIFIIVILLIALCVFGKRVRQYRKAFVADQVLVLIIPIAQYDDKCMFLPGVDGEVQILSDLWGDEYNYDVFVLNRSHLYATKDDIIGFADEHLQQLSDELYKAIIIHFIGHGFRHKSNNDNAVQLMTSDSKVISLDFFKHELEMNEHFFKGPKILFCHHVNGYGNPVYPDLDAPMHMSSENIITLSCTSNRPVSDGYFSKCITDAFTQNVKRRMKHDFMALIQDINIQLVSLTNNAEILNVNGTIRYESYDNIRFEKCKTVYKDDKYHALKVMDADENASISNRWTIHNEEQVTSETQCVDHRNTTLPPSYVEIEMYAPHKAIMDSVNQRIFQTTHGIESIDPDNNTSKSYERHGVIQSDKASDATYTNSTYDNDTNSYDMEIVLVSLHECIHFAQQIQSNSHDGGVTCSGDNDSDKTYNGSFSDHPETNRKGKHHQTQTKQTNDNHQRKHRRDEEDDDNKKQDDEEDNSCPCDDWTCAHLDDCPSCKSIVSRNHEQIKFFRGLIESLYGLTESLQCQIHNHKCAPFQNLIYNAIISKCEPKSKRKRNRKLKPKQNWTNIDLYPMRTTRRAKGNIQISKALTEHIIPDTIKEIISNVYAYLDRSITMQYNDGVIIDQLHKDSAHSSINIINCDFHETKTDEPLFCVVEKCTPNDTKKKYSRKMKDHLFTGDELSQFKLPKS
eukprot:933655_1